MRCVFQNNDLIEGEMINGTFLKLDNVTRKADNSSFYTCHAFNQIGNVSWTFKIFVHWLPRFIDDYNKTKIELLEGDPLELVCQIDSNPPSDVRHFKH